MSNSPWKIATAGLAVAVVVVSLWAARMANNDPLGGGCLHDCEASCPGPSPGTLNIECFNSCFSRCIPSTGCTAVAK
jgi:hypothetical protein